MGTMPTMGTMGTVGTADIVILHLQLYTVEGAWVGGEEGRGRGKQNRMASWNVNVLSLIHI